METQTLRIAAPASDRWAPARGEAVDDVIRQLPSTRIVEEAKEILARCVPPSLSEGRRTGLVIGYVQSGKTSSFTAVSSWAKDNGYQLIIVVAGISTPLFNQSAKRLDDTLHRGNVDSGWAIFRSDTLHDRDKGNIRSLLDEWRDPDSDPEDRRTSLICVMKQTQNLDRVIDLLQNVDLTGVKALIIDDEADQASLNHGVSRNVRTAIYTRLLTMRSLIPHVTYLQYTATPQAPLLIRLSDTLSPSFCRVLTAGDGYVGGRGFFVDSSTHLLRPISPNDIASASDDTPPDSLIEALRVFLLGACAHLLDGKANRIGRNRSMMIHPSHLTREHGSYHDFVMRLIDRWRDAAGLDPLPEERVAMMEGFRAAYTDLRSTVTRAEFGGGTLPEFEDLIAKLPSVFRKVQVTEINRSDRGAPNIRWDLNAYHILVGGSMLDRGYTVEGLTVTYMPRAGNRGNIDTIQQRARWFRYKEKFLGFCRVYLTPETEESYRSIVTHEEAMRKELSQFDGPLSEWKRRFFVEPNLRATRQQVVGLGTVRGRFGAPSHQWLLQKPPRQANPISDENWRAVDSFCSTLDFRPESSNGQLTEYQRHRIADTTLKAAIDGLLEPYAMQEDSDAARMLGLLLQLGVYAEGRPDEQVRIVKMSCDGEGDGQWTPRSRSRGTAGLHQGANPRTNYLGDSESKLDDGLTVQVFNIRPEAVLGERSTAPAIAVYVPQRMAKSWLAASNESAT